MVINKRPFATFVFSVTIFVIFPLSIWSAPLEIHFLDVGEGDCILIQTPKGRNVLVDTGNFMSAVKVEDYLKTQGINKLEYLIFTHPHLDHIGGGFTVLQRFDVENICDNGQDLSRLEHTSDVYRWYIDLIREDPHYSLLEMGNDWVLDGVEFSVFWPVQDRKKGDFNANSLILMVEYNSFKCLLLGDATVDVERHLLQMYDNLKADIIKVGHHGYDDASSQEFLEAVLPKVAVISVDKNNIRSYPSTDVLNRLKALGMRIYRTDLQGDVVFSVDEKEKVSVKSAESLMFNN